MSPLGPSRVVATTKRQGRPRQPRGGRLAQADTRRRRVRATPNANGPNRLQVFGRRVKRMKRMGPATACWSIISVVAVVAVVVTEGIGEIAIAGISLGVTATVAKIEARRGSSTVPAPPRKQAPPTGNRGPRRSPGTPGTPRPRRPAKTPPKTQPKQPINLNGTGGATRPKVCGDGCKRSVAPKNTCRCTAPDCQHGTMRPVTS